MNVGERVKAARIRLGLTQEEVATKAGISRAAISQWETGKTKEYDTGAFLKFAAAVRESPFILYFGDTTEGVADAGVAQPYLANAGKASLDSECSAICDAWSDLSDDARDVIRKTVAIDMCAGLNRKR